MAVETIDDLIDLINQDPTQVRTALELVKRGLNDLPEMDAGDINSDSDVGLVRDNAEGTEKKVRFGTMVGENADEFDVAVDSVADLRAASFPANLERLWLSGYYGVGTPGGGPFFRSSGTDDGGLKLEAGDGSIWERESKPLYYLSDFGGKADGTNADTELQAAVDALSGGSLGIDEGEWNITTYPSNLDDIKLAGSSRTTWTDKQLPVYDSVFMGGRETAIVSGVVKYDPSGPSGAGWYFLETLGINHDPILLGPVTASGSSSIILKVNIEDFGLDRLTWTPGGVVAGADESYAKQGVIVGASVGTDEIILEASCSFNEPVYIEYDGTNWTQPSGYTVSWNATTDRLEIIRDTSIRRKGVSATKNSAIVQPAFRSTGTQIVNMPVIDIDVDTVEVAFFDASGTQITSPTRNMRFYLTDPYAEPFEFSWGTTSELNTGNIWIVGTFARQPGSL